MELHGRSKFWHGPRCKTFLRYRLAPISNGPDFEMPARRLRLRLTSIARPQDLDGMLALSDSQLRIVWAAADGLPVEKRGVFLKRLVAQLQHRGRFTTTDLEDVVRSALSGLVQQSAA